MKTTIIIPRKKYEHSGKIRIEADTENDGCSMTLEDDFTSSKRFYRINMLEASDMCRAFQIIFGPDVLTLSNNLTKKETK